MAGGKLISTGVEFPDATTQTTSGLPATGGTLTGDLSLGDNVKAKFGASDDLQIYHDGSNSYVTDQGTGDMYITTLGNAIYFSKHGTENLMSLNVDSDVKLYYDNAEKLATTSTGIDVTGNVNGLEINTTATSNLGLGTGAVDSITTGGNNVGVGDYTLTAVTSADANTATGSYALITTTTGAQNTANGFWSLAANTTGLYNVAVGSNALRFNTTASFNTAIGALSLFSNTTGYHNTASGHGSLYSNTTGIKNTCMGYRAGHGVTTGYSNVLIGWEAGAYSSLDTTTGYNNVIVGAYAHASSASSYHEIVLGRYTKGVGNYYFTFGDGIGSNRVYNQFNSNASWTRVSDKRIKKDIQDNNDCGLDFINDLRTVTYKFKAPSELDSTMSEYDANNNTPSYEKKMYGFVAQEVKAAMDTHNITDFNGWHQIDDDAQDNMQGISYEMFVMPLVKAVQELSAENKALLTRIEALENNA